MKFITLFCIVILTVHLLILLCVIAWLIFRKSKQIPLLVQGKISILIAARNEENNIISCLEAIARLSYPMDKLEVLIGNDHSEDKTRELVLEFIRNKSNFRIIDIGGNIGKARGKANVLAQIAHHATGEYFFITDADIRVPSEWINTLLPHVQKGKNIVSGTTIVRADKKWWQFQEWEWLFLYLLNSFMQDIKPLTCSGNNMALSAEAYWKTGGYENIEFSVTEDYQLYLELQKHGYTHIQLFEKNATAWSAPVANFSDLLDQRKRWIKGGKGLPFVFWFFMVMHSLFLPTLLVLLFLSTKQALVIICLKIVLEFLMLLIASGQVGLRLKWILFPFYEIYTQVITISNFINLILPGKVIWKGRKY